MLAHEQPNGHAKGCLGFGGDRVERRFLTLRLERRVEVLRHALHTQRTDRRDPRVFDPTEHFLRRTFARRTAFVDGGVVIAQPQRELVADAADRR